MNRISRASVCMALALMFLLAGMGMAQQPQSSSPQSSREGLGAAMTQSLTSGPRMRPMHHQMGREATELRHMERLVQQLGLSDEQQRQVRPLLLNYAKEAIRDRADIAVTRLEIRQLLSANQPDLSQVKDMLQNIAAKEAQLSFDRITTMQDIRKLLTPEQQEQWRAMHVHSMSWGQREQWSGVRG
jgi:Spy/CpxP family protein refolding chaperone